MSRPAMRHNVLYPHNYLYYYHANIMKGSFLLFNPSPITIRPYAHVTQKPHTWHIQAPVTHRPPRRPITQDQLRISPPPPPAIEEPHPPGRQLPSTFGPERNFSLPSRDSPGTKITREQRENTLRKNRMPTPESAAFQAKKPTVPPTFDGVDYEDNIAVHNARDAIIREQWVRSMMSRLVGEELGKCYAREGVNHLEKCGVLRGELGPIYLSLKLWLEGWKERRELVWLFWTMWLTL